MNAFSHLMAAILCLSLSFPIVSAQSTTAKFEFGVKHRINAHGDEFNTLAKSSDGLRAYTGTEKGNVVIWNLISGKVERTLHQISPVHHLLAVGSNQVIAAGSNHHEPLNPVVRKWNVANGTFEDLPGLLPDSFPTAAAVNAASGLATVGFADGTIMVWKTANNELLSKYNVNEVPFGIAIVGREIYVVGAKRESVSPEGMPRENAILRIIGEQPNSAATEYVRKPGRFWYQLEIAPDAKSLLAYYREDARDYSVLIDPTTRSEVAVTGGWELAWIDTANLLRFENYDPAEVLRISNGKVTSVRKLGRMQNDREGRAFDQTGQIVNGQAAKAWATYRKGPGFLEFDLSEGKIKTLLDGPSGAYGISVNTKDGNTGTLATGGADGYVRVWNLSDLSMAAEFHVAKEDEFVTDIGLSANGQQAVVGVMRVAKTTEDRYRYPLEIVLLNLVDGTTKKLFEMSPWQGRYTVVDDSVLYPAVDRMKLVKISSGEVVREFITLKPVRKQAISANKRALLSWGYSFPTAEVVGQIQSGTQKKSACHVSPQRVVFHYGHGRRNLS